MEKFETLIVQSTDGFRCSLVEWSNGKEIPLAFLINSLKQLHIYPTVCSKTVLSAKKVIWLFVFCKELKSASLYINMSTNCAKVLKDHNDAFKGLSNLKHLALDVKFIHKDSDRKTWWILPWEADRSWKGNSRKFEAIFHLIQVTQNLVSFELAKIALRREPKKNHWLILDAFWDWNNHSTVSSI